MVFVFKVWRNYLHRSIFEVLNGYNSLKYLFGHKGVGYEAENVA